MNAKVKFFSNTSLKVKKDPMAYPWLTFRDQKKMEALEICDGFFGRMRAF